MWLQMKIKMIVCKLSAKVVRKKKKSILSFQWQRFRNNRNPSVFSHSTHNVLAYSIIFFYRRCKIDDKNTSAFQSFLHEDIFFRIQRKMVVTRSKFIVLRYNPCPRRTAWAGVGPWSGPWRIPRSGCGLVRQVLIFQIIFYSRIQRMMECMLIQRRNED